MKSSLFSFLKQLRLPRLSVLGLLTMAGSLAVQAEFVPELLQPDTPTVGLSTIGGFGASIAVEGDLALVGAPKAPGNGLSQGVAYVLRRSSNQWNVGQVLMASDGANLAEFGTSVAWGDAGNTLYVGAIKGRGVQDVYVGAVYVFTNSPSGFVEAARLVGHRTSLPNFGTSLSARGSRVLVGASGDSANSGASLLFEHVGKDWVRVSVFEAEAGSAQFGASVALDVSGNQLVIGAPGTRNQEGAAYFYSKTGADWSPATVLKPLKLQAKDAFGTSVAIESNVVVVGAPGRSDLQRGGVATGTVHVFRNTSPQNSWTEYGLGIPAELASATPDAHFGSAVSIHSGVIAVGAPDLSQNGNAGSGAIFLFENHGEIWKAAPFAPSFTPNEHAGRVVVLQAETLASSGTGYNAFRGRVSWYRMNFSRGDDVVAGARQLLYYSEAIPEERDLAAFRFKDLIYRRDLLDSQKRLYAGYSELGNLYGSAERERSVLAESRLWRAVADGGNTESVQNTLLDIYYDRTLAVTMQARVAWGEASKLRQGPPSQPDAWVISDEINALESVLQKVRSAQAEYFPKLETPTQDNSSLASFFSLRTPQRALDSAQFIETNGAPASVLSSKEALIAGYRDAVLLLELLRDQANVAAELGRLYLAWDTSDSPDRLRNLLATTKSEVIARQAELLNWLPDFNGQLSAFPELRRTMDALEAACAKLDALARSAEGKENPLGFTPDFLVLVQHVQGLDASIVDSFDAFASLLGSQNDSSALTIATQRLLEARKSYEEYRGYLDQLTVERNGQQTAWATRLQQLVGGQPGSAGYEHPGTVPGCEIWQQLQSIQVAQLRIDRNQAEVHNLAETVRIEIERRLREKQINATISSVRVRYGKVYAQIDEELGKLEAIQAAAGGVGSATGSSSDAVKSGPGGIAAVGGLAAGAISAAVSYQEGQLNSQRSKHAGAEQAQIETLQDGLLDNNSKAQIKTWLLQMNTLVIDSLEASILLKQELGRLAALETEFKRLQTEMEDADAQLSERYFADPAHPLRARHTGIRADLAFDEAQKWLFFMARALEYKWNTPFKHTFLNHAWNIATLFQLRNAEELKDFYNAMMDWNVKLSTSNLSDDYVDLFSLRDYFATRRGELGGAGTGTTSAGDVFRQTLQDSLDEQENVRLEFSTVTEIPGTTFFRGPRFLNSGDVDPTQKGLYLDKIRSIKIHLRTRSSVVPKTVTGSLTYGGTSYIRNFNVGRPDPKRGDLLLNEFQTYSTRYWYFHPELQWQYTSALSVPVPMRLSSEIIDSSAVHSGDVLPNLASIDAFQQRSVATSQWTLLVPTRDHNQPLLTLSDIEDIEIYFFHYASVRP